ncbi:MAG: hypothetical protein LBD05_00155 [Mycoplasmataceae bacterium]|nr:hypothetical protein [Mycoplasmataceae bacterium]
MKQLKSIFAIIISFLLILFSIIAISKNFSGNIKSSSSVGTDEHYEYSKSVDCESTFWSDRIVFDIYVWINFTGNAQLNLLQIKLSSDKGSGHDGGYSTTVNEVDLVDISTDEEKILKSNNGKSYFSVSSNGADVGTNEYTIKVLSAYSNVADKYDWRTTA